MDCTASPLSGIHSQPEETAYDRGPVVSVAWLRIALGQL
jgi:hypothetical protein